METNTVLLRLEALESEIDKLKNPSVVHDSNKILKMVQNMTVRQFKKWRKGGGYVNG